MYNLYLSIFIIILGFAFASNLQRIFIWTIPFSHQESYLETSWILTMCDVTELLHYRVCTTRDDSCRSCVKIGLCKLSCFCSRDDSIRRKIQISVTLKLTSGHIITSICEASQILNSLSLTTVPRIWKQHGENREMCEFEEGFKIY